MTHSPSAVELPIGVSSQASYVGPAELTTVDRYDDVRKLLVIALAALCLTPWASPPIALAVGVFVAVTVGNPFAKVFGHTSKYLLQICVVLLGFGMDLPVVLRAGRGGAGMAAVTISATFLVGSWLGKKLLIGRKTSTLICAGTAICGGSAIAAVASAIGVADAEVTVAMGTIFLLNAAALYLFPIIGHAMHLSAVQFGTWSGVAIHDISSVVGAASRFGLPALQTATAVKLSRALWIVPVSAIAAAVFRQSGVTAKQSRAQIPWFIGLFLLASVLRSLVPAVLLLAPAISHLATTGLTLTLFLVGSGMSVDALKATGWRPLVQGILLWLVISAGSLFMILKLA